MTGLVLWGLAVIALLVLFGLVTLRVLLAVAGLSAGWD